MISLIFAIDPHFLVGKGNDLPWHYPEDLRYFKEKTLHHTVIMGLETFQSIINRIGKPLPMRHSVVASLEPFSYPDVTVTDDLLTYLDQVPEAEEVFVIGGKTIYELTLPIADRLYVTHILKPHSGDVYLSPIDFSQYRKKSEVVQPEMIFAVYERR
ncbi:MAG: dihydrofolate reductase [Candidatus Izemoplasmatales bacterium]|jgi:dihydrofolate reductase